MAVAGLEPASCALTRSHPLYQLSYTTNHIYIEQSLIASCWKPRQHKPSRTIGLALINCLLVLLNIRIPAAHSAFILSHPSLGLTLLPSRIILCISRPTRGRCGVRNFPLSVGLYLRVEYRLFPLLPLSGLFRCRFDQCNVQACALAACTASVISTNDVAYLPGLPLRVPRRLRKVRDSNSRSVFAACLVSSEVLSSTQPTFQICLS